MCMLSTARFLLFLCCGPNVPVSHSPASLITGDLRVGGVCSFIQSVTCIVVCVSVCVRARVCMHSTARFLLFRVVLYACMYTDAGTFEDAHSHAHAHKRHQTIDLIPPPPLSPRQRYAAPADAPGSGCARNAPQRPGTGFSSTNNPNSGSNNNAGNIAPNNPLPPNIPPPAASPSTATCTTLLDINSTYTSTCNNVAVGGQCQVRHSLHSKC